MKRTIFRICLLFLPLAACVVLSDAQSSEISAVYGVLNRTLGKDNAGKFELILIKDNFLESYQISVKNNKVVVIGNSASALCRGAYDYLKNATNSIISWSGRNINIPHRLPDYKNKVQTPFRYRYYLSTVTHGYTAPYWGWERWEKEIDWMALHGMNMPLIAGAHEAILLRTFKKLGLSETEALDYFSGPAHFPWNRMGNIGSWDGPPPMSFTTRQGSGTPL